ncbi:MAG: hypothetical protein ACR2OO_13990, partial [Thermomicrobiales bacterium]
MPSAIVTRDCAAKQPPPPLTMQPPLTHGWPDGQAQTPPQPSVPQVPGGQLGVQPHCPGVPPPPQVWAGGQVPQEGVAVTVLVGVSVGVLVGVAVGVSVGVLVAVAVLVDVGGRAAAGTARADLGRRAARCPARRRAACAGAAPPAGAVARQTTCRAALAVLAADGSAGAADRRRLPTVRAP